MPYLHGGLNGTQHLARIQFALKKKKAKIAY